MNKPKQMDNILRSLNTVQRGILKVIQQENQISRTDLAGICVLSMPTVSRATKQLIDMGILIETESGESCGGRRPIMLEVNEKYGYVVCLDFECTNIELGIYDFSNKCVFSKHYIIRHKMYLDTLFKALDEAMEVIKNRYKKKALCISIAAHGILDEDTGTIIRSVSFGWKDVHLRDIVMNRYEIPVYLTLNMQLAAYAEWQSAYKKQGYDSLSAFVISHGAGSGTILNGSIVRGRGAAGEIGLTLTGSKNEEGKYLTLEELAGGQYLSNTARKHWNDPENVWLRDRTHNNPEDMLDEDILAGVLEGDEFSCKLFQNMIPYIGMGIVCLIRSYDPGLIILTGQFRELGDHLLIPVMKWMKENLLEDDLSKLKIEVSTLRNNVCVSGAAYIAFEHLFGDEADLEAEPASYSAAARSDDRTGRMFNLQGLTQEDERTIQ